MTATLRPDDPRIDRLAADDAAELRALLATTDWAARDAHVEAWLATMGIARVAPGTELARRTMLDASGLGERARSVLPLLAESQVSLTRYPVYSPPSWLRRWLGLEPPGALFRVIGEGDPRTRIEWIRASSDAELPAILATLPIAERVEVLVDLLDGGQDYRGGAVSQLLAASMRELDDSAGAWATRMADAPAPPRVEPSAPQRERAIFVALARAKVPIEPRWDALVPLSHGSFAHWAMAECLAAIPPERRAAAVLARLARAGGNEGALQMATEALSLVPDASIARWLLDRWDAQGRPSAILEAVRAVGRAHPELLEVVSAAVKPPALVPRAVRVEATDDMARAQREKLTGDLERDEPAPKGIRRYVLDRDGAPSLDLWLLVDSGLVFRAGTTEVVAEIVQGGVETADATLRRELRIALVAARDLGPPKRPVRRATPKKP